MIRCRLAIISFVANAGTKLGVPTVRRFDVRRKGFVGRSAGGERWRFFFFEALGSLVRSAKGWWGAGGHTVRSEMRWEVGCWEKHIKEERHVNILCVLKGCIFFGKLWTFWFRLQRRPH